MPSRYYLQFNCSVTKSYPTLCDPLDCSIPGFPVLHYLLEFAQIHVHWASDTIQPSHPLSSPAPPLPSVFPSTKFSSNESALWIRWPKYWSFSISPCNEHSVLISFRIDWFDLFGVQGALRSLLHHHNSKASIFQHLASFMVQLSHLYMTTGKTIALTTWTHKHGQAAPSKERLVMWTWTSKGVHSTPRANWTLWQSLPWYLGHRGLLSSCAVRASHCGGFSLQSTGSRHMGFSICSTQAQESWCTGLDAPQHVESS